MVAGGLQSLCAAVVLLAATASGLHGMPAMRTSAARSQPVVMMGRKFENNKLKMAKTALAYAKKASYIGKKVVIAVKAGGDDPAINRQLAAVIRTAQHSCAACSGGRPLSPGQAWYGTHGPPTSQRPP